MNGRPAKRKSVHSKPAAAVSQPPRDVSDRNGRAQRPPERQNEIGGEPEHGEREPEDLRSILWIVGRFRLLRSGQEACRKTSVFVSRHPRRDWGLPRLLWSLAAARDAASPSVQEIKLWA